MNRPAKSTRILLGCLAAASLIAHLSLVLYFYLTDGGTNAATHAADGFTALDWCWIFLPPLAYALELAEAIKPWPPRILLVAAALTHAPQAFCLFALVVGPLDFPESLYCLAFAISPIFFMLYAGRHKHLFIRPAADLYTTTTYYANFTSSYTKDDPARRKLASFTLGAAMLSFWAYIGLMALIIYIGKSWTSTPKPVTFEEWCILILPSLVYLMEVLVIAKPWPMRILLPAAVLTHTPLMLWIIFLIVATLGSAYPILFAPFLVSPVLFLFYVHRLSKTHHRRY